jgi:hypothetical protein
MALVALACVLPLSAGAAERVFQLRSLEDPTVSRADTEAFCLGAGFKVNAVLPARLWVHRARASDGKVVNDAAEAVGTAYACAGITSLAPNALANFYVRFNLANGSYTAAGQCTIISNTVPTAGLVLAGCHLRVTAAPSGVIGGSATSSSVFNPLGLTGFNTGSYWTLHVYDSEVGPEDRVDHSMHHHDMPLVEDPRSDQQILEVQAAH